MHERLIKLGRKDLRLLRENIEHEKLNPEGYNIEHAMESIEDINESLEVLERDNQERGLSDKLG